MAFVTQSRIDPCASSFGWKTVNHQRLEKCCCSQSPGFKAASMTPHYVLSSPEQDNKLDGSHSCLFVIEQQKYTGACGSAIFFVVTSSGTKPMKRKLVALPVSPGLLAL